MRLDVTVDDASVVQRREAVGDAHDDRNDLVGLETTVGNCDETVGQRPAGGQFHDEKRLPSGGGGGRFDIEDRHQRRVTDGCEGARLAVETLRENRVCSEVRRKHLHGDCAIEPQIERSPDGGHAPGSERRLDPVSTREVLADRRHAAERTRCATIGRGISRTMHRPQCRRRCRAAPSERHLEP